VSNKLDISFSEFFEKYPVSTRLNNLILRAYDDATRPFPTVLEFWENQNSVQEKFFLIDGFGEKSFDELQRRIKDLAFSRTKCNTHLL